MTLKLSTKRPSSYAIENAGFIDNTNNIIVKRFVFILDESNEIRN